MQELQNAKEGRISLPDNQVELETTPTLISVTHQNKIKND